MKRELKPENATPHIYRYSGVRARYISLPRLSQMFSAHLDVLPLSFWCVLMGACPLFICSRISTNGFGYSSFGAACCSYVFLLTAFFGLIWMGDGGGVAISISFSYYSVWRCRRWSFVACTPYAMLCVCECVWNAACVRMDFPGDPTTPFYFISLYFSFAWQNVNAVVWMPSHVIRHFLHFECFMPGQVEDRQTVVWSNCRYHSNVSHQGYRLKKKNSNFDFTSLHLPIVNFVVYLFLPAATTRPRTYLSFIRKKMQVLWQKIDIRNHD